MSTGIEADGRRYHLLKDWLLQNNIVVHHANPDQTEPFVMDVHFYGNTFEEAVDTLPEKRDETLRDESRSNDESGVAPAKSRR